MATRDQLVKQRQDLVPARGGKRHCRAAEVFPEAAQLRITVRESPSSDCTPEGMVWIADLITK